ncbi:MAG: GYD domain-containing protein [Actinomycetota bacterium]|nr:GYD domain-containing protein [Actinomycetota bacterium]
MPKYLLQWNFKGEALKGFMERPSDRAAVVDQAAQSLGGSLESYYWMFGQYDGFAVVDMPSPDAAARLSLTIASSGAFTRVERHELLTTEEVLRIVRAPGEVQYQAPGTPDMYEFGMP